MFIKFTCTLPGDCVLRIILVISFHTPMYVHPISFKHVVNSRLSNHLYKKINIAHTDITLKAAECCNHAVACCYFTRSPYHSISIGNCRTNPK